MNLKLILVLNDLIVVIMKDFEELYYKFYDDLNVLLIQWAIHYEHFEYLVMHQRELILPCNLKTSISNLLFCILFLLK